MQRQDFDFSLPEQQIAAYPLPERSASRLLHINMQEKTWQHQQFRTIKDLLRAGDLLVFNDTRVIPARLYGQKATGGQIEVLIERLFGEHQALAHIKASKAPKPGTVCYLEQDIKVTILERRQDLFQLQFHHQESVLHLLQQYGHIPLPPYIQRQDEVCDQQRYQTVYAKHDGSVAAPTAGLHFDEQLLKKLKQLGIEQAFITLHVGAGTFQPIRVSNIKQHIMHAELLEVSSAVCEQIQRTKANGGRVIAVGTTTVRSLETAAQSGKLKPYQGETRLFIYPGYLFQCIDGMITNFHLPCSSLLMLVCAFGGYDLVMKAYRAAVEAQYRFFSYGDAMLLL